MADSSRSRVTITLGRSGQGHWRFPGGKEMQGYAYILTHPGTPSVFDDHIFSTNKSEISALISVRNRNKINCRRSTRKCPCTVRETIPSIGHHRLTKLGWEPS